MPKKPAFKKPIFWLTILFGIAIFTALYFFLFFSGFQVQNIEVTGSEKVEAEVIKDLVRNNIGKKILNIGNFRVESKSIFLANLPQLQRTILSAFPEVETATVKKQFPQAVGIAVNERKSVAIFCQLGQECFLIDKNGVLFKKLENVFDDAAIIRQMPARDNAFVGDAVIERKIMHLISKLKTDLRESFHINISEAVAYESSRLDVKTSENWQIYFDLNSDVDLQIIKLHSLLKNEITQNSRGKLQYIDLRFKDRAYYK